MWKKKTMFQDLKPNKYNKIIINLTLKETQTALDKYYNIDNTTKEK